MVFGALEESWGFGTCPGGLLKPPGGEAKSPKAVRWDGGGVGEAGEGTRFGAQSSQSPVSRGSPGLESYLKGGSLVFHYVENMK